MCDVPANFFFMIVEVLFWQNRAVLQKPAIASEAAVVCGSFSLVLRLLQCFLSSNVKL